MAEQKAETKEKKGEPSSKQTTHPMRKISVEKVTLNIGTGKDQNLLEKGMKLIENLTGRKPVKTHTQKRIPAWGLRSGLPIGCKLTLRGEEVDELLPRLLDAKSHELSEKNFDERGNISFGIKEYIDIKEAEYDPEIGIMGLQVCVTLSRPGFRISKRKLRQKKVPEKHKIDKDEAIKFAREEFNVKIKED